MRSYRLSIVAGLLLAGCHQAPELPANVASAPADDGLPVKPGVYGNVASGQGMELQVHKLPRKLIELTFCEQGCKPVRRIPYEIAGEAMTFSVNAGDEPLVISLSQQGEDVRADGVGPQPLTLKRLPKREGLAQAEEAVRAGAR